jgi:hypothetical protein
LFSQSKIAPSLHRYASIVFILSILYMREN